ncbi:uncharacterized protein LOC103033316 isoform X1 [Astyanax mexicanus]|uniref:uncharacterized protein LOC103033316 isoform X1 n=1 Tax=Astyanax mexicanus TaxID=7994 RepID=UPI0020CB0D49|nr:uncharacterized protein LOC103033316 isoform X1 [Astyanax mexicanus]
MLLKYLVRLLTFCVALVSSNGIKCAGKCKLSTVNITLGSEVFLPCILGKSNQTDEVNWSHNSSLLSISLKGNITFEDPRDGRVAVFPSLFSKGNFSISIQMVQNSDLGKYCCQLGKECHRVELDQVQFREKEADWKIPWYYIVAGIGGLILLVIACSLIYEFRGLYVKKSTESYDVNSSQNEAANPSGNRRNERARRNENGATEEDDGHYEDMHGDEHDKDYETMQEHIGQHEDSDRDEEEDYVNTERGQGEGQYINSERSDPRGHRAQRGHQQRSPTVVYENDNHDPSGLQIRSQPQNRDLSETQSQPHSRAPYYVNQTEFSNPGGAAKRKQPRKKKKPPPTEYQFRNPIYGDSSVAPNK